MKIKLQKALDLIDGSAAVMLASNADQPIVDISASIDNELFISWDDGGTRMVLAAPFGINMEVEIKETSLVFVDDEQGDTFELKLLFPSQLASFCQESDIVVD